MSAAVQTLKPNTKQKKIATQVAGKFESVLRGEASLDQANTEITATVASLVAVAVAGLPPAVVVGLSSRAAELGTLISTTLSAFIEGAKEDKAPVVTSYSTQSLKGRGLGEIVTADEGRARLSAVSIAMPLEEWAGPVAGSTELERTMGIPRATLHKWQKSGAVIALLKGTKSHVFPTSQFIDGRPLRGIAEVNELAPTPRSAWLWLTQENELLRGKAPIDLLKADKVDEVVGAAEEDFGSQ